MKKPLFVMLLLILSFCTHASPAMAQKSNPALSDHQNHLKGPYPDGMAVTKNCLNCHRKQADEVLHSAHWLWQGPSPEVLGKEHRTDLGKGTLINNF
jgi:hypothetical protein